MSTPSSTIEIVASILKRKRKSKGYSQQQLAEKLSCHRNTVWNLENKPQSATGEMLEKVALVLEIELWRVWRRAAIHTKL